MTMMHRQSIARQDIVGVNEAQMQTQLSRESHRRWVLLQRLNVLERTNTDLKAAMLTLPSFGQDQKRLVPRSSSDGASIDWQSVINSCLAIAQSNVQMRSMIAKIVAEKQLIDYRLQHLSDDDFSEIESEMRRLAHQRSLKRSITNPETVFQELLQSDANRMESPVWDCERMRASELIATATSLPIPNITRYLELGAWCEKQRSEHAPTTAVDVDPNLDRNLGFSHVTETGFVYVFDEPDEPFNICYQTEEKETASPIRSGTLAKVIETIINPNRPVNDKLERAFFVTLPSLHETIDALELILQRFIVPSAPNLTPSERRVFQSKVTAPIQQRCLALLRKWLDQFPEDLLQNPSASLLEQHLKDLVETEERLPCQVEAKLLLEHFSQLQHSYRAPSEAQTENKRLDPKNATISSFSQVDDDSFVRCINFDDGIAFRCIQPREFNDQAWSKPHGHAPNIHLAITRFNRMTSFVQSQILRESILSKRAGVMARFIHLAEAFRKSNNYSAMCGIFAGLNSNAIHRLKQTWDALPKKSKSVFKNIKNLVSTNNNSRELRSEMKALRPPCIPHLALILKDLTFIDDGNADRVIYGMLNVSKILMITEIVDWVIDCQRVPYTLDFDLPAGMREYLEREFVTVDDESLWQLSQKIEPRKPN